MHKLLCVPRQLDADEFCALISQVWQWHAASQICKFVKASRLSWLSNIASRSPWCVFTNEAGLWTLARCIIEMQKATGYERDPMGNKPCMQQ